MPGFTPFRHPENWPAVLKALLAAPDPPINYGLSPNDIRLVAECFGWSHRWTESGWGPGTVEYDNLPAMVRAEPDEFLADLSRYYGDDYYLDFQETS